MPLRWIIFATVSAIYFLVQLHRVSPAILSVYLSDAFKVTATSLGIFSSMYFYPYAILQPIVGILTERLGGKRIIFHFTLLAFFGCLTFSFSRGIVSASIGRILVGIGVAGVYVPGIAILAQWFRPSEFGFVNSILLTVGTMGTIGASAPLAWSAFYLGWRETFWIIAAITLALSFLSLFIIREKGERASFYQPVEEQPASHPNLKKSMNLLLSDRFFWFKSLLLLGIFGIHFTFQGLWAYPFLVNIYKIDKIYASNILMMIGIGYISSSALTGILSDRVLKSRKVPLIGLTGLYALMWCVLALQIENLNHKSLIVIFYFMGFAAGGINPLILTMAKELFSKRGVGMSIGLINPSAFIGTAIYQPITGYLIDRGLVAQPMTPVIGYYHAFLLCSITALAAFALTFFLRETFGKDHSDEGERSHGD